MDRCICEWENKQMSIYMIKKCQMLRVYLDRGYRSVHTAQFFQIFSMFEIFHNKMLGAGRNPALLLTHPSPPSPKATPRIQIAGYLQNVWRRKQPHFNTPWKPSLSEWWMACDIYWTLFFIIFLLRAPKWHTALGWRPRVWRPIQSVLWAPGRDISRAKDSGDFLTRLLWVFSSCVQSPFRKWVLCKLTF